MIKTFELYMKTYASAANKANKMGHHNRASRLQDWIHIGGRYDSEGVSTKTPNQIGTFNFAMDIYDFTEPDRWIKSTSLLYNNREEIRKGRKIKKLLPDRKHFFSNRCLSKEWELVTKGPIKGYLNTIQICEASNTKGSSQSSDPIFKFDKINIEPKFIYMVDDKRFQRDDYALETPFIISIPVIWENEIFKIDKEKLEILSMEGQKILFSDRKSALKFKRILEKLSEYYPKEFNKIKESFMDNSIGEEWGKYLDTIKNIPINMFYCD